MPRFLILVAVAAVSLAVGAVIAIAVVGTGGKSAPPPAEIARPAPAVTSPDDGDDTTPALVTRRPKRTPSTETTETKEGPTTPEASAPAGQQADAPAGDDRAELRQMVASMTDEERQTLMRELMRRRGEERMERRKYDLPSDRRLGRLTRTRDETLRLTEAQQLQINTLRETYKPQLDTLLADVWQQQAELRSQAMELMGQGNRDEARALFEQMRELGDQAEQIKAPLEQQYQASLAAILTSEQTEAMAQQSDRRGPRDRGPGRRSFGGRPGGGNPGGG